MRSPNGIRLEMRMSVNRSYGFVPALRPRLPSRVGGVSRKHAGFRKPVGEKREADGVLPQRSLGVFAGTITGLSVGVLKSKLLSTPEIMLKGRPDTTSKIGATVQ